MRTINMRCGPNRDAPDYKRSAIVARRGNLAITRRLGEDRQGGYDISHLPTQLDVHTCLQGLSLRNARRALVLAASLGDWDWTDHNAVLNMPQEQNRSLWDALVAIGEMVRS